jgi:hypothetical protein
MTHFAQGWDPGLCTTVGDDGIRDVRDELYWQDVEPERGHFAFPERYERYMGELRRLGIAPLVELTFANKAYDGGLTPYTDGGLAGYARYGVEVLRHYGPQIHAVEIWNEYNGSFCKGPAAADRAESYARMARVAYAAIKRERPDVVVAGASTAGVPLPYLERLFAAGALDSMDAVSVHPYRYEQPPEGIEADIAALDGLIRRYNHGVPKPIWVTEIGWPAKPSEGDQDAGERVQASFLVRAYALLLSAGVERVYWYLFRDYGAFATMGLVHDDPAHRPKAAYRALGTMIAEIGGRSFVRREETADGLYCLLFSSASGAQVRVVWSLEARALDVPVDCRAVGMTGGVLKPGAPVTVGDEPVYIEGSFSGLPPRGPAGPRVITDSARDFSRDQGQGGWSYGMFIGTSGEFIPLTDFRVTDWKSEWFSRHPFLSLSDREQHPSESPAGPVAAVRRWTCAAGGNLRLSARFRCGEKGDGVTVKVLLGGRELFSREIGGPHPPSAQFDSVEGVPVGGTVDFAVLPGSKGNANFDATETSVVISEVPR